MASVFRDLDVVARFAKLQWPPDVGQPFWLLWPVWLRRIATPTKPEERLGPFERAVLNCARAGISDTHHIGDLLLVDHRLVKVIQEGLRSRGTLASDFCLTADGEAALDSDAINSNDIRTVYSFTCAITGSLFPRFTEQLYFADTKLVDQRLQIAHQTEGDERTFPCFRLLPPDDSEPSVPSAEDVLRAADRHARDRRSANAIRHRETSIDSTPPAPQLNRVHIIDQVPRPLFVATIVYRDSNPLAEPGSIVVVDPFGLGTTRKLRDSLLRTATRDRATGDWLEKIVRPSAGATEFTEDRRLDWDLCAEEAASRLNLTVPIPDILEQLTAVELCLLHSSRPGIGPPQMLRLLKQSGQAVRDALEAGFIELAARYPHTAIAPVVEELQLGDDRLIQSMLKSSCRNIGFATYIPQRFFRVRARDLQSVVLYRHFSKLATVVAASILVAERHPAHPFRHIAKAWPSFLQDTERALEIAGEAAHHQQQATLSAESIRDLREYAYECLRALLAPASAQSVSFEEKKLP